MGGVEFTKMHGTGNDYVFVNCFEESVDDPVSLAREISHRHTGVGSDGLILIGPSETAAVRMEMYNADGSRGLMCGNGIRCVAKYAYEHGLARDAIMSIETDDGVKQVECTLDGRRVVSVRVDMGEPRFAPCDVSGNTPDDAVIDAPIEINGRTFRMTCLSMGNPHAVIFVDSLGDVDLSADGQVMERNSIFPNGVNTHFVSVVAPDRVVAMTWERGSGRTQACGTGMSAVCVAGVRTARTNRRITAEVPGGRLDLFWHTDNHVYLTGPAVEVFNGTWPT